MEAMESEISARVIVAAVDMTEASEAAVLAALEMATSSDALHVIHAVEVHAVLESSRIKQQSEVLEHDPDLVRAYLTEICERTERWPRLRPEVHTRIGSPVAAIVQFCTDVEADVLITGVHTRHGIQRLMNTSVAEELVRDAPCPVLVAKPKSYGGRRKSEVPAPLCADCVAIREKEADPSLWCSLHARDYTSSHTYSGARGSVPPGFKMR